MKQKDRRIKILKDKLLKLQRFLLSKVKRDILVMRSRAGQPELPVPALLDRHVPAGRCCPPPHIRVRTCQAEYLYYGSGKLCLC